jgi:hypothetical protein
MSRHLLEPGDRDVHFKCSGEGIDGHTSLYAHSTVLQTRCQYYAKSTTFKFLAGVTYNECLDQIFRRAIELLQPPQRHQINTFLDDR